MNTFNLKEVGGTGRLYKPTYGEQKEKKCTICLKTFFSATASKQICSRECKAVHNREHAKIYYRRKRNVIKKYLPCIICGFSETSDQHSEQGKKYTLCPNHHCLITRGIKTLEQLWVESRRYIKEKSLPEIPFTEIV